MGVYCYSLHNPVSLIPEIEWQKLLAWYKYIRIDFIRVYTRMLVDEKSL